MSIRSMAVLAIWIGSMTQAAGAVAPDKGTGASKGAPTDPETQAALAAAPTPEEIAKEVVKADPIPDDLLKIRDPFKSPVVALPDDKTPRTDLELVATEKFKMVGVLRLQGKEGEKLRAMIIGPDGKTHFVSTGTKIGLRRGVITKITPSAVKIQEKVTTVLGQEEPVDVEIRMPVLKKSASR